MPLPILEQIPAWLMPIIILSTLFLTTWVIFGFVRKPLIRWAAFVTKNISQLWGQRLVGEKLLSTLSLVIPVVVFMVLSRLVENTPPTLSLLIERISIATVLVLALRAVSILLDSVNSAYSTLDISRNRPIKGFIQVFLILLYLLVFILVISVLFDKSPLIFLSGLGAMTAVLLLVFRDTLLSLVAGLQLTSNNYVQVGDWIDMPQFGADGDVMDIALHAVRVQNWDKTITVIPTHKFLEHSFKNWRGMQESGGRRIKRSIFIDMSSVQFLSDEDIEKFKRFNLLRGYIEEKTSELQQYNMQYAHDQNMIVNARRLTNIGTFRSYLVNYLREHPRINQDMTLLVRQLSPTAEGLPIEIYVFTNDIRWEAYEDIQSDIFDHVIAIAPEFKVRIFQNPTGSDFRSFTDTNGRAAQKNPDPAEDSSHGLV